MPTKIITAAMLAIGDELLSGRTKDKNIGYLADYLSLKAIDLKEVRIVSDEQEAIVAAVNALRKSYDYVFTSGGIGPTHDDITADAMAAAFDVGISHDPRALKLLSDHYERREIEFNSARKRMARVPFGAELISNPVSVAPGFNLENVFVLAGVPSIFQAMLDQISDQLESGIALQSLSIESPFPEGAIGAPLTEVQKNNPGTAIGSYPKYDGKFFSTQIVVRGREKDLIQKAEKDILAMFDEIKSGESDHSPGT